MPAFQSESGHLSFTRRAMIKKSLIISLFMILFTFPATASGLIDWKGLLDTGQRCSGLPQDLILSVIMVESGGNPNAVNINGVRGFQPKCAESALKIIYHYNNANVDIGLMQINWKTWGPVYGIKPAQLLDPYYNVCLGAKILRNYLEQHKWTWRGVGRYNAVSQDKQERYAKKVAAMYSRIKKIKREG